MTGNAKVQLQLIRLYPTPEVNSFTEGSEDLCHRFTINAWISKVKDTNTIQGTTNF